MITVGTLISLLVARVREHAYAAQARENETGTLYALSQDLSVAADAGSIIVAVIRHIRDIFKWESVVLLPEGDRLVVHPSETGLSWMLMTLLWRPGHSSMVPFPGMTPIPSTDHRSVHTAPEFGWSSWDPRRETC